MKYKSNFQIHSLISNSINILETEQKRSLISQILYFLNVRYTNCIFRQRVSKKDKVYVSYRLNKLIEAINQFVCAALAHTLIFCVNNEILFKNIY